MNKSTVIFSVLSVVLIFLLLIGLFIYTLFPVLSASDYEFSDSVKIEYEPNNVVIKKWHTGVTTYDNLYYDVINGENYFIIQLSFNTMSNEGKPFSEDILLPSVVLMYKTDVTGIQTRNFSAIQSYTLNHNIKLLSSDFYKGFLLPPSLDTELTTNDNPFYISTYYEFNNMYPNFYEVSSVGFDLTIEQLDNTPYRYELYVFGENYFTSPVNAYNLLGGALFTFSHTVKTVDFPRFDWEYNNIGDIFIFFKELFSYSNDIVEYIFLLVSNFFYSFSPFYFLR